MMQAIRTRAGTIIVKVLFGLLILSFGSWGIYTRSPFFQQNSPDTVVATVGDQSIRAEDVQQALQPMVQRLQAQFGGNLDQQQIKQLGIVDTVLAQLIDERLLNQEAQRLGLVAPDAVIRSTIYDNPAFRGPDGRFNRQLFDQALTMNHLSEDQLVAQLRHDIPRADLVQALTSGVAAPRAVIDALYRYRNEKRLADIVAFPAASIANVGQPSDADLKKFYDGHKDLFRAPEYRSYTLASLAPKDLMQSTPIAEDRLRKAYNERRDEFATPEQRDIQQILAPTEEKAKEAEAALKAGKDWKDVATTIAKQDPDTIDLGLLNAKEIPHQLGDVAFKLPLNQPSQPIKSPLGWHVLRVVKIEQATAQSFEQAKPKIEAELKNEGAVDQVDKIGNEADDALAGGASLAEVAKKFGLKLATITNSDANGTGSDGKPLTLPFAPDEIVKTVFATNQGETSRVTDTKDGAIFAVKVDKIAPPEVRPLADVKSTAVAAWQAEQKRDAAAKEAKELAAAVNAQTPLAKAAGDKGLTLLAALPLSRNTTPEQTVPPPLVAKLFAAKLGAVVTESDATGAYTAQLKEIQAPKSVPDTAAASLSQQVTDSMRLDLAGEFTEGLRKQFRVEIKREALDKMF